MPTNGSEGVVVTPVMENGCLMRTTATGCKSHSGKVRDIFDLAPAPLLVLVASDRISSFDVVMLDGIPGKGWLLTQISKFWFTKLRHITRNHLVEVVPIPFRLKNLEGHVMVGRKAKPLKIEAVVRDYLAGSGWKEYQLSGTVCGIRLPAGLRQCDKLPAPIFTPATKADTGHDENIDFERAATIVGPDIAARVRDLSLQLYTEAAEYAASLGIIIADTKFEFGVTSDDKLIWIDEALTPDSSRFWPVDKYEPGRDQESFDKQFLRNYLQKLVDAGKWDKTENNIPRLPPEIVVGTVRRYVDAYQRLTGRFAPAAIQRVIS